MTARSPHMITKITSTGHLLKRKALFSLRHCDSYHSLCLCQVYKEKIQYRFNQPLRPEQKANESCSLSSRAAPVTSSLGSRAAYCKWGRHPGIPAHLTSDWHCGFFALLLKNNNTSQQLPGVIYLNSTGDNYKWISSYGMFPALIFFFLPFLFLMQLIPNILKTLFLISSCVFNFDGNENKFYISEQKIKYQM